MKPTDLAYFAGIFDGEGCIVIHNQKHQCKSGVISTNSHIEINFGNVNEWIVRLFQFNFGGSIYSEKHFPRQTLWRWQCASKIAYEFLQIITPYLKLKRAQAEIALNFQRRRKYRGHILRNEKEIVLDQVDKILISNLNKNRKSKPE